VKAIAALALVGSLALTAHFAWVLGASHAVRVTRGAGPLEAPPTEGDRPAPARPYDSRPRDCVQATAFDARNRPVPVSRPLDRLEVEGLLHKAHTHWQTAEAQIWNERSLRHAWVAVAITLWVQACGGQ
jgi:hypothetical protein